jgi:hypothetical protein
MPKIALYRSEIVAVVGKLVAGGDGGFAQQKESAAGGTTTGGWVGRTPAALRAQSCAALGGPVAIAQLGVLVADR